MTSSEVPSKTSKEAGKSKAETEGQPDSQQTLANGALRASGLEAVRRREQVIAEAQRPHLEASLATYMRHKGTPYDRFADGGDEEFNREREMRNHRLEMKEAGFQAAYEHDIALIPWGDILNNDTTKPSQEYIDAHPEVDFSPEGLKALVALDEEKAAIASKFHEKEVMASIRDRASRERRGELNEQHEKLAREATATHAVLVEVLTGLAAQDNQENSLNPRWRSPVLTFPRTLEELVGIDRSTEYARVEGEHNGWTIKGHPHTLHYEMFPREERQHTYEGMDWKMAREELPENGNQGVEEILTVQAYVYDKDHRDGGGQYVQNEIVFTRTHTVEDPDGGEAPKPDRGLRYTIGLKGEVTIRAIDTNRDSHHSVIGFSAEFPADHPASKLLLKYIENQMKGDGTMEFPDYIDTDRPDEAKALTDYHSNNHHLDKRITARIIKKLATKQAEK